MEKALIYSDRLRLRDKVSDMFRRVSPQDLLGTAHHSRDFRSSRAEYISVRVRLLGILFAALAPLWIPIDAFIMPVATFHSIAALRIAFSVLLLGLAIWSSHCNRLMAARARLTFFLLVPMAFYVVSRLILGDGMPDQGVMVGYSFLPYLMVALLAVVPLTLFEGLFFAAIPLGVYVATEAHFKTLSSISTLGDVWMLSLLALIALWIQMTQLHMLMRLYREATRDALTGLVNRRVLLKWLDQDIAIREKSSGGALSVLLFDLDLFKRINDTYGHLAGDGVLQAFARIMVDALPEGAIVGRFGGEEFLAILPGRDQDQARVTAEHIRDLCHRTPVRNPDNGEAIAFTTSVGVAEWHHGERGENLIGRVDVGLYQAKESGRDLVAVAS